MSNRKIIISIIILIFIILITFFIYPLPLDKVISINNDLTVFYTKIHVIDGNPEHETANYYYEAGSEEIEEIKEILGNYTYHRNIRSFKESPAMEGNDAGYWLTISSGDNSIVSGGTGEIMINSHVYNIDYWGNKKSLLLMEEILSVLD